MSLFALFKSDFVGLDPQPQSDWPQASARSPARVFVGLLLVVVTTLFALISIAYLMRSQFGDWRSLAGDFGGPLDQPVRLWLNTALLLASSVSLQWASVSARREQAAGVKRGL